MTKVAIVGLGLIGGSLGLDLRSHHEVLGVSHKEETCQKAEQNKVVDKAILLPEDREIDEVSADLLKTAEIVFICTPINKIASSFKKLIPYLSSETIVTDVASVKVPIVRDCLSLIEEHQKHSPSKIYFLGGHPMAGTEKSGIEAAQKDLFKGASYVFTPTDKTAKTLENVKKLRDMAENNLGSIIYECSPTEHDRAVAWISHLPVMISASLIDACTKETDQKVLELAKQLASSGFRDTSRVGGGNPELGLMMAEYNQENLLRSLSQYRHSLDRLIELIEQKNWDSIKQVLLSTQASRPEFLS
jgi:arogenate dehydrogenase (NADP+)